MNWAAALLYVAAAPKVMNVHLGAQSTEMYKLFAAIMLPMLVGASLEPFPDNAGMASSCQMFLQYALMGLTAGVVAPLAWHSLLSLAVAHAGMVAVGFVLLVWQRRLTRMTVAVMG